MIGRVFCVFYKKVRLKDVVGHLRCLYGVKAGGEWSRFRIVYQGSRSRRVDGEVIGMRGGGQMGCLSNTKKSMVAIGHCGIPPGDLAARRCIHEVPRRYDIKLQQWEPLKWYWEPEIEKGVFYSILAPFSKTKADAYEVLEVMVPKYLKWNLCLWGIIKFVSVWYGIYYVYKFFTADVTNSTISSMVFSNFSHFGLTHLFFDAAFVSTLVAAHYRYLKNSYIWYVCIVGALGGPMGHNFLDLGQSAYKERDQLDQIDYALLTNRKGYYLPEENVPYHYPGVYNPGFGAAGITYSLLGSLMVLHSRKRILFFPATYILMTTLWVDLATYLLLSKQHYYISPGTHLSGAIMGATIASIRRRCHLKIPFLS